MIEYDMFVSEREPPGNTYGTEQGEIWLQQNIRQKKSEYTSTRSKYIASLIPRYTYGWLRSCDSCYKQDSIDGRATEALFEKKQKTGDMSTSEKIKKSTNASFLLCL